MLLDIIAWMLRRAMLYEERGEMATRMTVQPPPSVYYDERGRRLTVLLDPLR